MNIYTLAGMITGIVICIIIVKILFKFMKKDKKEKFTYDERQVAQRGKAYKYAFFTLAGYNALYGIINMAMERPWVEPMTAMMIGICLAVLVHVGYSIWHECYFSMNEEPKRVLLMFGVISIMNIWIAVRQGREGGLIQNGMLTNNCANLVAGIMFIVIMIILAIKWQVKKHEADEEE